LLKNVIMNRCATYKKLTNKRTELQNFTAFFTTKDKAVMAS
jgi:hypothetical protein